MPQLDTLTFFTQFLYLTFFFFLLYFLSLQYFFPNLIRIFLFRREVQYFFIRPSIYSFGRIKKYELLNLISIKPVSDNFGINGSRDANHLFSDLAKLYKSSLENNLISTEIDLNNFYRLAIIETNFTSQVNLFCNFGVNLLLTNSAINTNLTFINWIKKKLKSTFRMKLMQLRLRSKITTKKIKRKKLLPLKQLDKYKKMLKFCLTLHNLIYSEMIKLCIHFQRRKLLNCGHSQRMSKFKLTQISK